MGIIPHGEAAANRWVEALGQVRSGQIKPLQLLIHGLDVTARPIDASTTRTVAKLPLGLQDVRRHTIGHLLRSSALQFRVADGTPRERGNGWRTESVADLPHLLLQLLGSNEQSLQSAAVRKLLITGKQHAPFVTSPPGQLVICRVVFVSGVIAK
jgi:hypothetical protein